MTNEQLYKLAELFSRNGYQLYEVGGHVRDKLMGRKPSDLDLATNALPMETIRVLESAGFNSIYTIGMAYGCIGLKMASGEIVEITTFRDEVYPTEERKPIVKHGISLNADLARRDFTINAIAIDPLTSNVIDPFGGINDIHDRVIKCVGNPTQRYNEDPLRMMRAVRFACQLGFTLESMIKFPSRIQIVSPERISAELTKILLTSEPALGLDLLCYFGIMNYIIPEFSKLSGVKQSYPHTKDVYDHTLHVVHRSRNHEFGESNLILRLAAMLHDIGKPNTMSATGGEIHFYRHQEVGAQMASKILARLCFPGKVCNRVTLLVDNHMAVMALDKTSMERKIINRFIRKIGEENIFLLMSLAICDMKSSAGYNGQFVLRLSQEIANIMHEEVTPSKMVSPIDGNEIMEACGLTPCKTVGDIKHFLTELVINGDLDPEDKHKARVLAVSRMEELCAK